MVTWHLFKTYMFSYIWRARLFASLHQSKVWVLKSEYSNTNAHLCYCMYLCLRKLQRSQIELRWRYLHHLLSQNPHCCSLLLSTNSFSLVATFIAACTVWGFTAEELNQEMFFLFLFDCIFSSFFFKPVPINFSYLGERCNTVLCIVPEMVCGHKLHPAFMGS